MALDTPFGPDGLERIKAAEEKLLAAQEAIKRARLAGLDVSAFEQRAKEELDRVRKLRAAYYPNG
jgi:hypothetical protein